MYDSDIDIITCKTASDAKRLYSELKKATDGNKFLIFTEGMTSKNISTWVLNKLRRKLDGNVPLAKEFTRYNI